MHEFLKSCRATGLVAVLALLLQSCGGVIVGNPHGGGSGSKPTQSGQVQFMIVSNQSQNFKEAYFNIKAMSLVQGTQRTSFSFDSVRRLAAGSGDDSKDVAAGLSITAPAQTFDRIELELDPEEPAAVVTADPAENSILVSSGRRRIALKQDFAITADDPAKLRLFLDLDRSIVRQTAASTNYELSPVGGLTVAKEVRKLTVASSGAEIARLCVFRPRVVTSAQSLRTNRYLSLFDLTATNSSADDEFVDITPLPEAKSAQAVMDGFGTIANTDSAPMEPTPKSVPIGNSKSEPNPTSSSPVSLPGTTSSAQECSDALIETANLSAQPLLLPYAGIYVVGVIFSDGTRATQQVDLTTQSSAIVQFAQSPKAAPGAVVPGASVPDAAIPGASPSSPAPQPGASASSSRLR